MPRSSDGYDPTEEVFRKAGRKKKLAGDPYNLYISREMTQSLVTVSGCINMDALRDRRVENPHFDEEERLDDDEV